MVENGLCVSEWYKINRNNCQRFSHTQLFQHKQRLMTLVGSYDNGVHTLSPSYHSRSPTFRGTCLMNNNFEFPCTFHFFLLFQQRQFYAEHVRVQKPLLEKTISHSQFIVSLCFILNASNGDDDNFHSHFFFKILANTR